jgi:DUF4097 and DUF4098 domain-containing protein YvlB
MPTFSTPTAIPATISIVVGTVRITASDRTDTVVDVRPSNPSSDTDVKAVQQTRIEYSGTGPLLVKTPKVNALFGQPGSVDLTIELPAGSEVRCTTAVGNIHSAGRLGESTFVTSAGNIEIDETGPLNVRTSAGDITVDRVMGSVEATTGTGALRIREIEGPAVVKNSNGDTWIGTVTGDARLNGANGAITVDHAGATVTAKTANGNVRLADVVRGSVMLMTAYGDLEVGIREGVAAWLDVSSHFGTVHNSLTTATEGPGDATDTVEVNARTSYGDVLISRS